MVKSGQEYIVYTTIIILMVAVVAAFPLFQQATNDVTGWASAVASGAGFVKPAVKAKVVPRNTAYCENTAKGKAEYAVSGFKVQGELAIICQSNSLSFQTRKICNVYNGVYDKCVKTGRISNSNMY